MFGPITEAEKLREERDARMELSVDELRVLRVALAEFAPSPYHGVGCAKCEARQSLRTKVRAACLAANLKPPEWDT